ncbi:DHH family phosphoesterase [Altibacter sp. HG106]|uniref:DHH family phosphoesterase n=1 Tax=Altibacter sp. HG106 TaxID=3023937 RepID=UPI002350DFF2|nr:DHH family phosphoesterase [Altibacter sp. HG106]MDC7995557.1 DHH family phosphoesterase [Altibacter sp. HG106]
MNTQTTSAVKKALDSAQNIVIIGHKNPDGDAIGSCLGLAGFLRKKDYSATVVMPNDFPEFLKWMPGCDDVLIFEKQTETVKTILDAADVIFTLDFNALNRSGDLTPLLEDSEATFVMIDHHQQPDDYAAATYSDASMSSTAQMVFHCIEALEGVSEIDADIATNLYTGIMTDTGSFRFPATTATTHRVIAQLIENGAVPNVIHENIYDTASQNRMKLLGVALDNLTVLSEYRTAYITLSQEELDRHEFRKGDTEGFVNYALSIKDIVFALIFIENRQENIVKISLRSKGPFSVNEFSRKHFHGGGHNNAAGGRSLQSLDETVHEFISILPQYQKALIDA